jgi:hypothetical protein
MGDNGSTGRVYGQSSEADVCGITVFLALKKSVADQLGTVIL